VIATHRVQRDLHDSFLLFRYHLTALIMAAVGADAVRQHRLVALAAILHLDGFNVLMTPPFSLAGVRRSPFWNCHDLMPSPTSYQSKARYRRSPAQSCQDKASGEKSNARQTGLVKGPRQGIMDSSGIGPCPLPYYRGRRELSSSPAGAFARGDESWINSGRPGAWPT